MQIDFELDGRSARFERDPMTGRAVIVVGDDVVTLSNPFNPLTHFRLRPRKVWRRRLGGHEIQIVKDRPVVLGALRENSYSVIVDGIEVASATGT